jgi:hypothetical protein
VLLERLAGDGGKPAKERIMRRRQREGRGKPAGKIETLRLGTKKFGLALGRAVLTGARRRGPTASAGQQARRQVSMVGINTIARRHFLRGAKHFRLAKECAAVLGLSGNAQLAAPGISEQAQCRSHSNAAGGFGAGQEQIRRQREILRVVCAPGDVGVAFRGQACKSGRSVVA